MHELAVFLFTSALWFTLLACASYLLLSPEFFQMGQEQHFPDVCSAFVEGQISTDLMIGRLE